MSDAFSFDALVLAECVAAFGEAAQGYPVPQYTPAVGAPFAIDGIFDAGFAEVQQLDGPPIASAHPTFGTRVSQVPAGVTLAQADTVVIRGTNYQVREVRPDSHGGVRLLLNIAPP